MDDVREKLVNIVKNKKRDEIIDCKRMDLGTGTDLSALDLSYIDFTDAVGDKIDFTGANLSYSNLTRVRIQNSNYTKVNFQNAVLDASDIRYSDFTGCDFRGTKFRMAFMEKSIHKDVLVDDTTENYRMTCPETGPFVCYKKCYGDLLVQLLVPADARRSSDTSRMCRCDKAKVLNITNFDHTEKFTEARSLCGRDFYYHVGEYVYEPNYNDDRWLQSTYGIHFFMTEEEAKKY